jgi:hypothetical protein
MTEVPQEKVDGHEHDGDREFRIEVVTTAEDVDASFNSHDPLRTVWDLALALVGGEGQPDQFKLEYKNHLLTDLDRTIGHYADEFEWHEHVELELIPTPVVV